MTRPLLACFVVLLVVTGCTESPEVGSPQSVVQTPATQQTERAPVAEDVQTPHQLDFTLPALDGGQVRGAELAGQALAMWFWTPW